ncbi:Outer membrane protein OmpA [Yoonia tamlensis]|uniref:Outer membrane protein OmpA n=1 Tax=Yoonia tamlensis TaxID=390270 RepID=A0A1I6FT65_9RHOB|nr:OmpA family protein [Yoonia tamlensis]SFR33142.1 Outer membrane protein OmpA [Yoonia tamlensis]
MPLAPLKASTALVASLSLIMPHPSLISAAWAQDADLRCLDQSLPPCPEGERPEGYTPAELAEFAALAAQALAAEEAAAEAEARAAEEAAAEAEARAAEEAAAAEAEARAAEEATAAEAEARAAEEAAAAEAEARAADEAAAAEAEARAAEEAAAAEAEARAAEEAAAAEAEARAAEEAAAAEAEARAADEAAAAEAEARAAEEAAAAEAEARAAEEAAAAEAEARAAEEAAAAEAEARAAEEAAAAEAEARAAEEAAAAEAEARAAEEAAAAEAEARAAEEAAAAEAEARAAEEAAAAEAQTVEEAAATEAQPDAELVDPTIGDDTDAPAAAAADTGADAAEIVEETLDADTVRTSEEDFETPISAAPTEATTRNNSQGLSNIEKALLVGLGAVVVGSVLRNGDRVVENTGDRVVVEGTRGLTIYKDDDAILRQTGASVRTETFSDGSTRTVLDRADGTQVVTIRDTRGRVLRRAVVYPDGTQIELFDDVQPVAAVDVQRLEDQRPTTRNLSAADSDLIALRAALRETLAYDAGRSFSLRQIREIEQVRRLVPAIDLDTVTFASGSAAISAEQALSLVRVGILIEEMLFENPREVFLIEGHTDATGSESFNLTLSDRRAESVALALTESFDIPPENLIVQGYGEGFLKVQTQSAEAANRRATVRRITPLLRQLAAN